MGGPLAILLVSTIDWGVSLSWLGLLVLAPLVVMSVRPWFLGVWADPGIVRIRSWFRIHRFVAGDAREFSRQQCQFRTLSRGALTATGVASLWLPPVTCS